MGAWAETTVHGNVNPYPPREGEACADCDHVFALGERAFKDRADDEWFCAKCADGSDPVDEWPYPDEDPPDPL